MKIGVLTSGGDAPGMNAAVRAVCRSALYKGMEVVGIMRGYNGLLNGEVVEMNAKTVSGIIQRGGTCLYTARCNEFRNMDGVMKGKKKCEEMGLDGIVVIGGDGSFRGAADLSKAGIPCIGIPGTIDNDIACTDYTIGYDTAMNTAMEMVDKIKDRKPTTMSALEDIWYEGFWGSRTTHYNDSRYHFLNLHSFFHGNHTVELRGFNSTMHAGELRSYIVLALALNHQALTQRKASAKKVQSENDKFAMRTYLNRIGFIGKDFKNCRDHLTKHLTGSAAWRYRVA